MNEPVTATPKLNRLPSWIPPSFAWTTATDVFAIKVPIDDSGLAAFVASGEHWVTLHRTKKRAQLTALLLGTHSFTGQMELAAWTALRRTEDWKKHIGEASLPWRVLHSGRQRAAGPCWCHPSHLAWPLAVGSRLHQGARTFGRTQSQAGRVRSPNRQQEAENERIFGSSEEMAKAKSLGETLLAVESFHQRPVLTPRLLLPHLSSAETFQLQGP